MMVEMLNSKEPEACTYEAVAAIFGEVLGHKLGYSPKLGHSVMPESPKLGGVPNEEYERLAEENKVNRKSVEYYQKRLEEIECGFVAMREHMLEYEKSIDI